MPKKYIVQQKHAEAVPNVTAVGSVKFQGNTASVFSSNNYLLLPQPFDMRNKKFEIVCKFRHKNGTEYQPFIFSSKGTTNSAMSFYINKNQVIGCNLGGSSGWYGEFNGSTVLVDGATYWAKLERETADGVYRVYLSTDGIDWNLEATSSYTTNVDVAADISYIGRNSGGAQIFLGEIDLANCYINANDTCFWSGVKSYTGQRSYFSSAAKTMTVPNITTAGSRYDTDTTAFWNFSASSYITVNVAVPTPITSIEYLLCIRTGLDVNAEQTMTSGTSYKQLPTIGMISGKLRAYLSSNGSSNNIFDGALSSPFLQANTKYYVRYTYAGSIHKIDVSTDGTNYTTVISANNASVPAFDGLVVLGMNWYSKNLPFLGQIFADGSFLKINGQILWSGTHKINTVKEYISALPQEIQIPVISAVGNVTFDGTMAGNFSNTAYLYTIPGQFTDYTANADNWEMVFKFTYVPNSNDVQALYAQGIDYESQLSVYGTGVVRMALSNSSSSFGIGSCMGTTVMTSGQTYWAKAEFTGSAYNVYLSTDGNNWSLEGTINNSTKLTPRGTWRIGVNRLNTQWLFPFLGKIDLSGCYININGSRWWSGSRTIS